jgi:hypothetical protein
MKLQHVQHFIQNKYAGQVVDITTRTKYRHINRTCRVNADDVVFKDMGFFTSIQYYVENMRITIHTSEKSIISIHPAK